MIPRNGEETSGIVILIFQCFLFVNLYSINVFIH